MTVPVSTVDGSVRIDGARDSSDLRLGLHANFVGGSAQAVSYPAITWFPAQF